ncbi:MAG: DUF433 domain-containing protein [Candidatus Methylomirabilia bacterium]
MSTVQKSLRIPKELLKTIDELAEVSRQDFSAVAIDLLTEAARMRRCPGIVFADGPAGRRARIAGTGLDVWEVIATWNSLDREFGRVREAYSWLSEPQLRAALGYYAAYPEEIDRRIALNERWTEERLRTQHPSLAVYPR